MRRFIYICALLAMSSCYNQDVDSGLQTEGNNELRFGVSVSDPVEVAARSALQTGMIDNMYVLIFDESGYFISRHRASLESTARYKVANVPVKDDNRKRVLHFVCNYDWSAFSDVAHVGKSEAELIPDLKVSGGTIAYWQRVELPQGIHRVGASTSVELGDLVASGMPSVVSLLRNVAQISTVNNTQSTAAKYLTNMTFAVGDYLDNGTVAPFNRNTGAFAGIIESPSGVVMQVVESNLSTTPKFIYERENETSPTPTYVIVKGLFQVQGSAPNTSNYTYYKIDIVNRNAAKLLNLIRNNHYILSIDEVKVAGYSTLQEAMSNAASNNIVTSVIIREFNQISDGTATLRVDATSYTFVTSTNFSIGFAYTNASTGTIDNTGMVVTLAPKYDGQSERVLQNSRINIYNGTTVIATATVGSPVTITGSVSALQNLTLTGTTNTPDPNDIFESVVTLTKGNLSREITLRLRAPIALTVVPTPRDGSGNIRVGSEVGQPVMLAISFPESMLDSSFPLDLYVRCEQLSPDASVSGNNISVVTQNNGTYLYKYRAQRKETQYLHFVTNTASIPQSDNKTVVVSGDLFAPKTLNIYTATMPSISGSFSPEPASGIVGQEITLSLNLANLSTIAPPYTIRIMTEKLEFVRLGAGASGTVTPIMGSAGYEFVTSLRGTQSLVFRTRVSESGETVRISGDGFNALSLKRTSSLKTLQSLTISPVPVTTGVGTTVNIAFGISPADLSSLGGSCEVYIFTSLLGIPSGNAQNLVPIYDNTYGAGYKYVATTTNNTVSFVTTTAVANEKIRVHPIGFNSGLVWYRTYYIFETTTGFDVKPKTMVTVISNTLSFNIPSNYAVSAANPLWVWLDSGSVLNYYKRNSGSTALVGISNIYNAAGTDISTSTGGATTTDGFWMKITSTGQKSVTIRLNAGAGSNRIRPMYLSAVTGLSSKTSNGKFLITENLNN